MQSILIVHAPGDEHRAEELGAPLRDAGYQVIHDGTIMVGDSSIGESNRALDAGIPVVLCGTAQAMGTVWTEKIINAANSKSITVFVVQMESHAAVQRFALGTKIARYWEDPIRAVTELLESLMSKYPPSASLPVNNSVSPRGSSHYLDEPTGLGAFHLEEVDRFRSQMREDILSRFPITLSPWQFLERAHLMVDGVLTRTWRLVIRRGSY